MTIAVIALLATAFSLVYHRAAKARSRAEASEERFRTVVAHIPEYYAYNTVAKLLTDLGVTKAEGPSDNLHDDPGITMNMMVTDPQSVRWDARVKAGKATINGVSIADKAKNLELARKIVDMRAANTVAAIKKAIANKGKVS